MAPTQARMGFSSTLSYLSTCVDNESFSIPIIWTVSWLLGRMAPATSILHLTQPNATNAVVCFNLFVNCNITDGYSFY